MKRQFKKVLKYGVVVIVSILVVVLGINFYVKASVSKNIIEDIEKLELQDIDCILILGAGIWNNKPSPMLKDRLLMGLDLYEKDVASKIIVSGDHGKEDYDEVNVMKNYLVENKVPSENVFMDHAGFSTYDSIYRAKEIFKAKNVVIVTQKYHLYRALYIAKSLGLNAYGVSADARNYTGATYRELREVLARDKDFIKCLFKVSPTYLGEEIPVSGNGNLTNDKKV